MSNELVFRTPVIKVVNKGGGTVIVKKDPWERNERGRFRKIWTRRNPGCSRIIFACPRCKQRNNRSLHDAKYVSDGTFVAFKCHGCYNIVEVFKMEDGKPAECRILDANGTPVDLSKH